MVAHEAGQAEGLKVQGSEAGMGEEAVAGSCREAVTRAAETGSKGVEGKGAVKGLVAIQVVGWVRGVGRRAEAGLVAGEGAVAMAGWVMEVVAARAARAARVGSKVVTVAVTGPMVVMVVTGLMAAATGQAAVRAMEGIAVEGPD